MSCTAGRKMAGDNARHDNNFNFLRLAAATLVVVSHSFQLSSGEYYAPLGLTFGDIAVDIFFVTSGFLVTGSLLSRRDVVFYVRSRLLRIYPGLIVSVGLTVFLLGPLVTKLPVADYLLDAQTLRFLLGNATLFATEIKSLPGVFEGNPFGLAVNNALWTLEWEMTMYWALFLFALPYVTMARYRSSGLEALRFIIPLIFVCAIGLLLFKFWRDNLHNTDSLLIIDVPTRMVAMFSAGASLWLWRDRVSFSGRYGLMLLPLLLVAALISPRLFVTVYYVAIAWLTLILAHCDLPWLRRVNGIGDYSYGIYIYSFPIQQAIVMLWPGIGPAWLFVLSIPCTLPFAVLSWHVVEKRALALKQGFRARALASLPV